LYEERQKVTTELTQLSDALAAAVKTAGAGIVRVDGRRRLAASGIIWAPDAIVTAHHVLRRDENISVGLPDGQEVQATVAGRDPTTDLAVLRLESGDAAPAMRAEAEEQPLKVGHVVLALGRPGRSVQATLGVVSALGGAWRTPAGGQIEQYLQTDVLMYPGFSGGPLVNGAGQVIGLNTSGLLRGVSLALPLVTVARVADALLAHGRVRRGYLGISTQPVRLPEALQEELNQETGLLLTGVEAGGPAGQGGLLMGDAIVAFDGSPVRYHDDLMALLAAGRAGAEATIRIVRSGQLQELQVTIGER
jgi:S1-C subfamily serine protease